jgi:hypothetical protein
MLTRPTVPQARVLKALRDAGAALSRPEIAERAGFTGKSGTVTRAMNGIPEGSSSGKRQRGLIDLGYVERKEMKTGGGSAQTVYTITDGGLRALNEYLSTDDLGELKDKEQCTNQRYKAATDGEEEGVAAAWHEEVRRRLAEIQSGQVTGKPAAQVFAEVRERYK